MDQEPLASGPQQLNTTQPRRAAIYARVSTDRQKDEATIESQCAEVEQAVSDAGDTLLPENVYIDDGYTGELLARPALDQLRDAARSRHIDVVYVYDRGRLSRRFAHQELILEELADNGVAFVSLHDAPGESPEDRVIQAMQGVFHEYDRIRTIERFRRGRLFKVRSGRLLGYQPKYGYDYVPKTRDADGYFRINEADASVVRKIFQWVGNDGCSVREVVRRLYQLSIPPRRSGRTSWTTSPVHRLLTDETYTGTHFYNKSEAVVPRSGTPAAGRYRRVKKTTQRRRPREEWIGIQVPAIISRELFERTQAQLRTNKRFSPRNAKNHYLLRGLVYCPCGRRLVGHPTHKTYSTYRCTDRLHTFPLPPTCARRAVRSDIVDELVWNKLQGLTSDPDRLRPLAAQRQREQASDPALDTADRVKELETSIRTSIHEEQRYGAAFGEGALSLEVLKRLTEGVRDRRALLESELTTLKGSPSLGANALSEDDMVRLAVTTLQQLNFDDRAYVVRMLLVRVVVCQEEIRISGHIPVSTQRGPNLCSNHPTDRYAKTAAPTPESAGRVSPASAAESGLTFELKLPVPPADHPPHGYSQGMIQQLRGGPATS